MIGPGKAFDTSKYVVLCLVGFGGRIDLVGRLFGPKTRSTSGMARVAGESRNQGSDKCLRLILKVECDIRDDFTARVCRCRGC